jgi:PAS domain S-box-containing protein
MGREPRILYVDADAESDALVDVLEDEYDIDVVLERTVSSALDALSDSDVDCVVSAFDLGEDDGLSLLERVRATQSVLPFVLFPRDGSESIASDALNSGVTEYVPNTGETDQYRTLGERVLAAVETDDESHDDTPIPGVGYWEFEREGGTVEWGSTMYDICDEPQSSSPTFETTIRYYHPADRAEIRESIDRVIAEGSPETLTCRLQPTEREVRWVKTDIIPQSADGETVGVRVTAQNVTEYKHRIQELERERGRYESLFENVPNPVLYGKADTTTYEPVVLEVNDAFEETFGYEEETMLGEPLEDYVVPDSEVAAAQDLNRRIIEQGELQTEVQRETPDGVRTFRLDVELPKLDEDVVEGYAIYTDITERKAYEQELERTNERLEQFRSMIAHDLRSPLTVAQLRLDLADQEYESEHLSMVDDALSRMEAMLDSMLMLARTETASEDDEHVPLVELTRRAWQHVPTEQAAFESKLSDEFTVDCTPDLVEHVFQNLFQNSVTHNDSPVTVTVGPLEDQSARGLYVADDGSGVPADERDQLFEHGFTTSDDGTGFGLAIVEELVEAHDWRISVTDSEAGGARFEIRFDGE